MTAKSPSKSRSRGPGAAAIRPSETELRAMLRPAAADRRVVEVCKLAITALLDAGAPVSRNSLRDAAARVAPPSGRKAGITKSTLDRNEACRALFEAAFSHRPTTALIPTGGVAAHVARLRRAPLAVLAKRYEAKTALRRATLDASVRRLSAHGLSFDLATLAALETIRDAHRAFRTRAAPPPPLGRGGSAAAARSVSLVRRSIAAIERKGDAMSRKAIVAGTATLNKGTPVSDSTIDRNRECRRLVDKAMGLDPDRRLPPAAGRMRHRDLAEAVMIAREVWRETRRLSFAAGSLLADHDARLHREEARRRWDEHQAAVAAAERIMESSKHASRAPAS